MASLQRWLRVQSYLCAKEMRAQDLTLNRFCACTRYFIVPAKLLEMAVSSSTCQPTALRKSHSRKS